jgi:hypothetical protein
VFVDEYATVPHLSIERMLALHSGGHLDVIALGRDHRVDSYGPEPGATVLVDGERHHFPAFVDATGQRALEFVVGAALTGRAMRSGADVAELKGAT